ncbi:MAG TPA: heparinase, partial [Phenylobacterium sp.]|nr:heparinase [Phenylobacterium sp.]
MAPVAALDRIPGGYQALAAGAALRRRMRTEWAASPLHHLLLAGPRPEGLGATPRDLRPADPEAGRHVLAGAFVLAGETLTT